MIHERQRSGEVLRIQTAGPSTLKLVNTNREAIDSATNPTKAVLPNANWYRVPPNGVSGSLVMENKYNASNEINTKICDH